MTSCAPDSTCTRQKAVEQVHGSGGTQQTLSKSMSAVVCTYTLCCSSTRFVSWSSIETGVLVPFGTSFLKIKPGRMQSKQAPPSKNSHAAREIEGCGQDKLLLCK